jgi:phage-related protein
MAQYNITETKQGWRLVWHPVAHKEFRELSPAAQYELQGIIDALIIYGKLKFPDGRKIAGKSNLFEIRTRKHVKYRLLYAYDKPRVEIVCLTVFGKKMQKTPLRQIETALQRWRTIYETKKT